MVFLILLSFAMTSFKIDFSGPLEPGRLVDRRARLNTGSNIEKGEWLNERNRVRAKSKQVNQVIGGLESQLLTFYSIRFGEVCLSLQNTLAPTF